MSVQQDHNLITTEEYRQEWRRLKKEGARLDDPRMQELFARVDARDDFLFEKYGKPFLETHYGKWIAISPEGNVIIRDSASEVGGAAREAFGPGNFSKRKLAEFPGHILRSSMRTFPIPM